MASFYTTAKQELGCALPCYLHAVHWADRLFAVYIVLVVVTGTACQCLTGCAHHILTC